MKKILFITTNFRHGGTNKSLENLLSLLDKHKYQIDVFAMEYYGPYERMLPNCTILKKDNWLHALISQFSDTKGVEKLRSLFVKTMRNLLGKLNISITDYLYKRTVKKISDRKEYDTVIAYSEGAPTAFVRYFHNKNKVAWVHCDYASYMQLNNQPDETAIYQTYDAVVCVSEFTRRSFCKIIPSICDKVYSIHNVLNEKEINELALKEQSDIDRGDDWFKILSIGRIDSVKRFEKIPEILRVLIDRGVKCKWYLIGPKGLPTLQKTLEDNIVKYQVEDTFIWLGEKDNPYPYIKYCDLLVNLSITEACPYVINEAKILFTPVVCTNFGSSIEFITDNMNGYIAPIEEIADKIELLAKNTNEYNRIQKNIADFQYGNVILIQKIERLV